MREECRLPLLGVQMLESLRLLTAFLANVGFWWIMPQGRREMGSTVRYESTRGPIQLLILLGCGSFDRVVGHLKERLRACRQRVLSTAACVFFIWRHRTHDT